MNVQPGDKRMQPFCVIDDNVARIAINIPIALERIGITKVYAKNVAVDWLHNRCSIPRLIAWEVVECLLGHHRICSQGNKLCDIQSECSREMQR